MALVPRVVRVRRLGENAHIPCLSQVLEAVLGGRAMNLNTRRTLANNMMYVLLAGGMMQS